MGLWNSPGPASNSLLSNSHFCTIILRNIFRPETPKNTVSHDGRKENKAQGLHMSNQLSSLIKKTWSKGSAFSTSGEKGVWGHDFGNVTLGKSFQVSLLMPFRISSSF